MKFKKRELELINVDLLSDDEVIELDKKWGFAGCESYERYFYTRDYEYKPIKNLIEDINGFLVSNGLTLQDDVQILSFEGMGFDVLGRKEFPIEKKREELKRFIVEKLNQINNKIIKNKEEKEKKQQQKFELYQKLKKEFEK